MKSRSALARAGFGDLVGAVAILAVPLAAAVVAAGCVTVPAQTPHARVMPSKTPRATEVCWLETASTDAPGAVTEQGFDTVDVWHATASALLVKHPDGDILVDTGASPTLDKDLREVDDASAFLIKNNSGLMPRRGSLNAELAAAGADRGRLRILLSHVHPDHTGGLAETGDVPVLLAPDDLAFAVARAKAGGDAHVLPAHVRALRGRAATLAFKDGPYETFDASADLFGDGSVVVVPLPGHTPGSVGTFINLTSGKRIFHVGDVVLVARSIDDAEPKGVLLSLITDVDRDATAGSVALVARLHAAAPDIVILPAHDRSQWVKAVGPRAVGAPPVCSR